ncbi:MAG: 3-deoxy-D-manno-octulosonic acid transferase [Candidatus Omnitrophota bacterium]
MGKWQGNFLMRCGKLPLDLWQRVRPGQNIWVHAVSVGEVKAAAVIINKLREKYPTDQFIVSTITSTGNKVAKEIITENDILIYLPFDFSFIIRRIIARVRPKLFLVMETELWPNLIMVLDKYKIPIVTINGRISDKSYRRYLTVKRLLKPVLSKISLFCMRTEIDQQRIVNIGADRNKVMLTGNIKYDLPYNVTDEAIIQKVLKIKKEMKHAGAPLLVCGSTHEGEESIILRIYGQLRAEFPDLKLLIAPRHTNRIKDLKELLNREKMHYGLISELMNKNTGIKRLFQTQIPPDIYLLDIMGNLWLYFALADVVFIGGSIIPHGGHNLIEAAAWSKAIVFGRYMFNFKEMAEIFLNENAACQATDEKMLFSQIRCLLADNKLRTEIGARAKHVAEKNRGAVEKTIVLISKFI